MPEIHPAGWGILALILLYFLRIGLWRAFCWWDLRKLNRELEEAYPTAPYEEKDPAYRTR
jgi:hypothetical protein